MIAIQNEREWADFCSLMRRQHELVRDPRGANNAARLANRAFVDHAVARVFTSLARGALADRLTKAQTAFGNVNSVADLIAHLQLRTRPTVMHGRGLDVAATPWSVECEADHFAPAPALDAQGSAIGAEFGAAAADAASPVSGRALGDELAAQAGHHEVRRLRQV